MKDGITKLSELLKGDWFFEIPVYQRGYAWEDENLRDLWDDLYYLGDRDHYFGTILLKRVNKKTPVGPSMFNHYDVIDGQQRLTTTIILMRELIEQIRKYGNEEMSSWPDELERDWIVRASYYKLTIGGDDKKFFQDEILTTNIDPAPKTQPQGRLPKAQERLSNAQSFFRKKFNKKREKNKEGYADFLAKLISHFDRLQVMQYIVPSAADAVRMFEMVNDRGRPLTNLEKTKSILMYAAYLVVDSSQLDALLGELQEHFMKIYRCLMEIENGLGLSNPGETIQRYHDIFYLGKQSLKYLLMEKSRRDRSGCEKLIRHYAESLERAFTAVQEMAQHREQHRETRPSAERLAPSPLFYAMERPCVVGHSLDRLIHVGYMANLYPLLIVAWQKFDDTSEREEILRLLEAFVFRVYRVGRLKRNAGQPRMNGLAHEFYWNDRTFADLQKELVDINHDFQNNTHFRQGLADIWCYYRLRTGMIRYLLAQYEEKLRRDAKEEEWAVDLDTILSSSYETEHILPQEPRGHDKKSEEEKAAHQKIVHRLGNLTILSKECNLCLSNHSFQEKKEGVQCEGEQGQMTCAYRNSRFRVTSDLTNHEKWNEKTIVTRGDKIIDFALERWRIDPGAG